MEWLPDQETARTLALALGAAAIVVVGLVAWSAWRDVRRLQRTAEAADLLVEVHLQRTEASSLAASSSLAAVGEHGELLARRLTGLRDSVGGLQAVLGAVGSDRDRLRRELLDTILPTRDPEDGDER